MTSNVTIFTYTVDPLPQNSISGECETVRPTLYCVIGDLHSTLRVPTRVGVGKKRHPEGHVQSSGGVLRMQCHSYSFNQ